MLTCNFTNKSVQSIESEFKYEVQIDGLVNAFLTDSLMNSFSVGIYHKGEEFVKHYGELDPGKKNKPTNNTIYDIASVTKTFVGTLIAQAEREDKLSIEDDIRDYLEGSFPNLQYKNEPIRIKHLVTHTSGLPTFPLIIQNEFSKKDSDLSLPIRMAKIEKDYSKKDFFEDLKEIKIDTIPGCKYNYSNLGAELASYIIEKVYKSPFEKVLEENIWKVANMTSTMIKIQEPKKQFYANGYGKYKIQRPPMNNNLWGGSGQGKSTIIDLLNYIKFQLNEDNLDVQNSHKILFDTDVIDGDSRNKMAYMWMVSTDRDFGQVIKHHGGGYGTQNWMLIYPEEELGISIITNQSGRNTAGKLLDVAYGILDEIAKDKK